jgi:hypothetical protein
MDNLMFPITVPMKYPSHDKLFRDEKFKLEINEHNAKMASSQTTQQEAKRDELSKPFSR